MGRKFSPLVGRIRAYQEVRKLVESGTSSPSAITRRLREAGSVLPSRTTVQRWASGKTSPLSTVRQFAPEPSEELSFFLGAWLGDGWAEESDGGKRMLLKVRSYDFAKEFAVCSAKVLGKTDSYWVRRVTDRHGKWYLVKATSIMLHDFVIQPFEDLSKWVEPFPDGFLRGFYTAEGNPSISIEHTAPPYLGVGIAVSNCDRRFLEFTRDLLLKRGFSPGAIRLNIAQGERTNLGVALSAGLLMTISKIQDVRRFATEIGFADSEKQAKLADAISLVGEHGTRGAAIQWTKRYEKIGKRWLKRRDSSTSSER